MLVLCISDAPPSLRGDLTKWLIEINVGVYVGRVSARVREELWKRVIKEVKAGRVTMVYRAQNEQGLAFRVHNSEWMPIDFDGLSLMLHPDKDTSRTDVNIKHGFSNAAFKLKQKSRIHHLGHRNPSYPDSYIVLDIETTGLNEIENEIIEIGALLIENGKIAESFFQLTQIEGELPEKITKLTGITASQIEADGADLEETLIRLLEFIKDHPIVAHNAPFDMAFIRENCLSFDIVPPNNRVIDTLEMSRRLLPDVSHRLEDLMAYFGLSSLGFHRCRFDCENLQQVYCKLIEIESKK